MSSFLQCLGTATPCRPRPLLPATPAHPPGAWHLPARLGPGQQHPRSQVSTLCLCWLRSTILFPFALSATCGCQLRHLPTRVPTLAERPLWSHVLAPLPRLRPLGHHSQHPKVPPYASHSSIPAGLLRLFSFSSSSQYSYWQVRRGAQNSDVALQRTRASRLTPQSKDVGRARSQKTKYSSIACPAPDFTDRRSSLGMAAPSRLVRAPAAQLDRTAPSLSALRATNQPLHHVIKNQLQAPTFQVRSGCRIFLLEGGSVLHSLSVGSVLLGVLLTSCLLVPCLMSTLHCPEVRSPSSPTHPPKGVSLCCHYFCCFSRFSQYVLSFQEGPEPYITQVDQGGRISKRITLRSKASPLGPRFQGSTR